MINFVIYDKATGRIKRVGRCRNKNFKRQVNDDTEAVLKGIANQTKHKVVNGMIVEKTQAEIEADKPKPLPFKKQRANITNEQLQNIQNRLEALEGQSA